MFKIVCGFLFLLFSTPLVADEIKFETADLKINGAAVHAKVADTNDRREYGLMFVRNMPANDGMLFAFDETRVLNFWMKNTLIPLSIGFFDEAGVLIDVQEMTPLDSLMVQQPSTYQSSSPALFALEMNKEWFKRHKIATGAKLKLVGATKSALLKRKMARPSSR